MAWSGSGRERVAVGIVGMGYVGLPLALQFARNGCCVTGFDIDTAKVEQLKAGRTYIHHVPAADVAQAREQGRFDATDDFRRVADQDAILICVPTPLDGHREPDLSYVLGTGRSIAPHLRRGQLISLESTTYPGTTDEDLLPVLEAGSNLKAGIDFHLVFSPEREDPGNPRFRTQDIPKVVGGLTPACREAGCELYRRAVKDVIPVSSTRAAEATKLMENIFRCINIAMVNELKVVFDRMGVDIWEVIEAAKTKPFGFMPFYPGPGLGGHCIPIDPFYLTWKAREYGVPTKFIELAGEINTGMPRYVVGRLMEALSDRGRALKGAKVLILGLAYKKNVDDPRESPSFELWELLRARGAVVSFHDPYIPKAPKMRHHPDVEGTPSTALTPEALRDCDVALIATDHDQIDYEAVVRNAPLVVDTRNACANVPVVLTSGKVVKA
jgi:UDP-N-acetyl-D-glucosamine dehydrogenase